MFNPPRGMQQKWDCIAGTRKSAEIAVTKDRVLARLFVVHNLYFTDVRVGVETCDYMSYDMFYSCGYTFVRRA